MGKDELLQEVRFTNGEKEVSTMSNESRVKGTSKCQYCQKKLGTNVTNEELIKHLIDECPKVGVEVRKMLALQSDK